MGHGRMGRPVAGHGRAVWRRPGPAHYMGYSVLQSPDNRAFDIIDARRSPIWQQRTIARWERPASQKSVLFIKKANSPSLANQQKTATLGRPTKFVHIRTGWANGHLARQFLNRPQSSHLDFSPRATRFKHRIDNFHGMARAFKADHRIAVFVDGLDQVRNNRGVSI